MDGEAAGMRGKAAFSDHAGRRETAIVAAAAAAAGLVAGLVFMLFPSLDLAASNWFQEAPGKFALAGKGFWQSLREVFLRGFTLWYVTVVLCGILALRWRAPVMNLAAERWIYLALCSLAGPLLLVNVVLKEHWGRWRPREVLELGGAESFTPVLQFGGSCSDNCSFVSGEVASMTMLFMGLAFATRHWRPIHYGLAVAMGALEGYIRVGQGGHFLSDAIFAMVLMALVAAGLHYWLFLSRRPPWKRSATW